MCLVFAPLHGAGATYAQQTLSSLTCRSLLSFPRKEFRASGIDGARGPAPGKLHPLWITLSLAVEDVADGYLIGSPAKHRGLSPEIQMAFLSTSQAARPGVAVISDRA